MGARKKNPFVGDGKEREGEQLKDCDKREQDLKSLYRE